MNIGFLGAGHVGATLARRFRDAGHSVVLGVRDPRDPKHASLRTEGFRLLTPPEALAAGEVLVLTTPWAAAQPLLESLGDFGERVLLDVTNPIGAGFTLTHGHTDSGGEQVQRWARGARVVKVFNSTGVENMADPAYPGGRAFMPLAGDDEAACATAATLAREIGFEPVHVGRLDRARLLEPLAMLWITLAMSGAAGRHFAFGVLHRGDAGA